MPSHCNSNRCHATATPSPVCLRHTHPQALDPSAAQLSAATLALINTLIARQGHARGLVKLAQTFSFARWGLEGYVIAESNRLMVGGVALGE